MIDTQMLELSKDRDLSAAKEFGAKSAHTPLLSSERNGARLSTVLLALLAPLLVLATLFLLFAHYFLILPSPSPSSQDSRTRN
jgi:hypothetical protein